MITPEKRAEQLLVTIGSRAEEFLPTLIAGILTKNKDTLSPANNTMVQFIAGAIKDTIEDRDQEWMQAFSNAIEERFADDGIWRKMPQPEIPIALEDCMIDTWLAIEKGK